MHDNTNGRIILKDWKIKYGNIGKSKYPQLAQKEDREMTWNKQIKLPA